MEHAYITALFIGIMMLIVKEKIRYRKIVTKKGVAYQFKI